MKNEEVKRPWLAAAGICFSAFFILNSSFPCLATNVNVNWDNGAGNSDFGNATNWSGNILPNTGYSGVGDFIRIDLTGANKAIYSATIDNAGTGATSAQAGIFSRLQIADVSGNAELDITGGTFKTDSTFTSIIGSSGRTGTLAVSGAGTVVVLGGYVVLGNGTAGTGVVSVVNGSFTSSRDGTVGGIPTVSLTLGNGNNAHGIVKQSGGQVATRSGMLLGAPGTTGTGRFEVDGGGLATIGSTDSTSDGFWLQSSNSVLAAYVTNSSLGTIFIEKLASTGSTYGNGNVIFMPGSKLEVGFLGAPTNGSWTLMRWSGSLLTNGLTFAASVTDTNWHFTIDNTNGLRITYGTPAPMVTNSLFVHPGVVHSLIDLERMRTNVLAGNYPWYIGYTNMIADSHSSSSYPMEGPMGIIWRDAVVPALPSQFQDDCGAAYQNALLWYLTGDHAHAFKAIEILDAWASTCTNAGGSDTRLACGLQGYKFITAAEIIRYTGAGWSQLEINTCSNFIRTVILPQNRMYGGGNWGQIGACSAMAAGVFMDDEAVFSEALNCLKFGAPIECDMGMVNYINPLGWTTESDRDIGHWGLALDNYTEAASIAWCQGIDLWTYLNNRLLTAHEYLAYFNANNTTNGGLAGLTNNLAPYIASTSCDGLNNSGLISQTANAINQLGTWFPLWEQAFNPYQNLIGVAALWTSNAVAQERPEGYDRDHLAFGTLVAALPTRTPGLPIMPSGLTATWSNVQVKLVWYAASNAASYYVKRAATRGGTYTNIANAITATNYTDNTVSNNALYFYKVSATNAVGETANSGLASAYPSATAPAAPGGLAASTTSHTRIDIAWGSVPGAMCYTVKRSTTNGGPYATIASGQGTIFLTYADTGLTPGTTYYYVLSATNIMGSGSNSFQASATTLPALPSTWTYSDAGYQTTPGNSTYTNGAFTVKGSGLDYGGGNADSFGFAYLSLAGNGTIIARIAARSEYSGLDKIGLTLRETLANGSKHVLVLCDGSINNSMLYRSSTDGNGTSSATTNIAGVLPEWLKLNRTGNVFTGSLSLDGTNWTVLNTVTITMSNTLLCGFAVCSRNNGVLDTAVFDNVSVTGLWPALPGTPAGLNSVAGDASAFLNWATATNATGYNLKRANASAGPYAMVATNWNNTFFTNTSLVNGTVYYYVVSGTNYFGESTNSSSISTRAISLTPPALDAAPTNGNQLQFAWPVANTGWHLEVQTNALTRGLGTNWFPLAGSYGTNIFIQPITPSNGSVFFRLGYP